MLGKVVVSCLIISLFVVLVYGNCAPLVPPYVPLSPTSVKADEMDTCCWYSKSTCCGYKGELYDLTMIKNQIDDMSSRGLSDKCYYALTNLFCFWCDPDTTYFVKPPKQQYYNVISLVYLCPAFCDELFFKCFDDIGKLSNNPSSIHTTKDFCEDIILDNFYSNSTDIFPNVRFIVSDSNALTCYGGTDANKIIEETNVCIPENDGGGGGDPIVFASSPASFLYVNLSFILSIFAAILLFVE